MQVTPNRLVALATAVLGIAAAVAVPLANLDWSSTAGVIAGVGAAAAAAVKWLEGWQAHEERTAAGDDVVAQHGIGAIATADPSQVPPDEGDAVAAEGK